MFEPIVWPRVLDDIDHWMAVRLAAYSQNRLLESDVEDNDLIELAARHDRLAMEALVAGLIGYEDMPPEEDWDEKALCYFVKVRAGENFDLAHADEIIDHYVRSLMAEVREQAALVGLPEGISWGED